MNLDYMEEASSGKIHRFVNKRGSPVREYRLGASKKKSVFPIVFVERREMEWVCD